LRREACPRLPPRYPNSRDHKDEERDLKPKGCVGPKMAFGGMKEALAEYDCVMENIQRDDPRRQDESKARPNEQTSGGDRIGNCEEEIKGTQY
jgi:hypothetical protein